jgi:alginate O-acetyltransferase complex protein AlgI
MTFNSPSFLIFLPLVFLCFYFVRDRYRWFVLLLASFIFYAFILKPILLVALTAVILVTNQIGWFIERSEGRFKRRSLLWLGIFANLALLIYFKYLPFIIQNLTLLLDSLGINIVLVKPLPMVSIGLSFYIFQAISYLADIYFRMAKPERHLGYFALYMAFFPKLLQGPIERASHLIPQLKAKYELNYDNMRFGMLLFTWGLFKKVVIADRLALYVDPVYNDVHAFTGLPLLMATYAYAFQLYMDFSGYTDMALGCARLFNLNLTQNFNSPFLANSVADFWRRWHISLSRWILDYIFEPVQMLFRNMGKWGTAAALVTTFILVGIWHGANWTFIVFGLIHGIYLAASFVYKPYQKKLHKALGIEKTGLLKVWQVFVTFNLVSLTFVFIRATNLRDATYIILNMLNGIQGVKTVFLLSQGLFNLLALGMFSVLMVIISVYSTRFKPVFLDKVIFRWMLYYALVFSVIFFAVGSKSTFIYFTF